jgi:hypothetical protein
MSTKRKTYQIFTLFNKEISKNLPKYQAWSNGASRGNIEKKGAQQASPGMHFKFLFISLRSSIWKEKFQVNSDTNNF